jgi:hypothetical protein
MIFNETVILIVPNMDVNNTFNIVKYLEDNMEESWSKANDLFKA